MVTNTATTYSQKLAQPFFQSHEHPAHKNGSSLWKASFLLSLNNSERSSFQTCRWLCLQTSCSSLVQFFCCDSLNQLDLLSSWSSSYFSQAYKPFLMSAASHGTVLVNQGMGEAWCLLDKVRKGGNPLQKDEAEGRAGSCKGQKAAGGWTLLILSFTEYLRPLFIFLNFFCSGSCTSGKVVSLRCIGNSLFFSNFCCFML